MMKINLRALCLPLCALLCLTACKKDKQLESKQVALALKLENPQGLAAVTLSGVKITFREINSGKETVSSNVTGNALTVSLTEGSYDISLDGNISYQLEGKNITGKIGALKQGLVLTGAQHTESLKLFLGQAGGGFLIQEIFFTGTLSPEGKQYLGDKYFKIYNNSGETLYADGLVIAQSAFQTATKEKYTPDVMSSAVAVESVIMIPGSGKQYPVLPGKYIVVSEDAINHKANNANSIDLSKADFEFFYEDSDDIDNPQVPNMETVYGKFNPNNRGYNSYVLARFEKGAKDFLSNYKYDFSYDFVSDGVSFPVESNEYKIPNSWILDMVNLSVKAEFQWVVTDPSLDMGWTFCAQVSDDAGRYGKSVRRRVLSIAADGSEILKDTNNSTNDFEAGVRPSLMK